jgi:hypothetical protein
LRNFQLILVRRGCKKNSQNQGVLLYFTHINAPHNDIRKTVMADTGRTLESAAHFTRGGGAPAQDHDADNARRSSRVETEQRRLIAWAKENGELGFSDRLPPEFARGGEHRVFFKKEPSAT